MLSITRIGCLLAATTVVLSTGCASITGSTDQTISVQARSSEGEVAAANCELDNDKGKWFVTAPGSTRIGRSHEDLIVTCRIDDAVPGIVTVESATKGSMVGNILFGGLIGVAIDHSSGAAYEYPTLIEVLMGQVTDLTSPPVDSANQGDDPLGSL